MQKMKKTSLMYSIEESWAMTSRQMDGQKKNAYRGTCFDSAQKAKQLKIWKPPENLKKSQKYGDSKDGDNLEVYGRAY